MIRRLFNACLCRPEDFHPSRDDVEVVGAFNPGAIDANGEVLLLVRIAERPREHRRGQLGLPRWRVTEPGDPSGLAIDWVPQREWEFLDPRVVRNKHDGLVRLTSTSHLRLLHCGDGRALVREEAVRFEPRGEFETFGVEDPRITRIGDTYWITYVAVSRHGPATALASTKDFRAFERHGVIFPVENKDVALFPEKVDGDYVALHRPLGGTPFTKPEMWLARSPDLLHWGAHAVLLGGSSGWDADRVGAGTPPVRVSGGWLEIYHGSTASVSARQVGAYSASAIVLDAERPERVLCYSREPLLVPETEFERKGFVPNVLFPTGVVDRGETLLVFYGAADTVCGVVELAKSDISAAMPP